MSDNRIKITKNSKQPLTVGQILESMRRSVRRVEGDEDDNGSRLKNLSILKIKKKYLGFGQMSSHVRTRPGSCPSMSEHRNSWFYDKYK